MKCAPHGREAHGVCMHCGRAVCPECAPAGAGARLACSAACARALEQASLAMGLLVEKSLATARASAFYSYLCGGLSLAGAVGAWFYLPVPFLIWFTAGCGAVFLASGVWYTRIARRNPRP